MSVPAPEVQPEHPHLPPAHAGHTRTLPTQSPHARSLADLLLRPFLLPFLLLGMVALAVIGGVNLNAQAARQVTQAQSRLILINALARDTSDLESGQRGYVITGQADYLKPYLDGMIAFEDHARELAAMSAGPRQYDSTQQALALLRKWRETAAEPEIAARRNSLEDAVNLVGDGTGKRLLDEVRTHLNLMRDRENNRLQSAVASSTQALRTVRLLTLLGLILGALLFVVTAIRAARRVTAALTDLTAGTREIAAGQYGARLPRSHIREIDDLSGQVHEMARAVQEREQALAASAHRLELTNEQLQRSNRELEQFAYVASHDLQEPLRTIGSYTELLARRYQGQLDARADQYIAFTISATERLKTLIQDLLAFSRVRQGQGQRTFAPVDTQATVQHVLEDLAVQIGETGAQVSAAELPTVRANAELLRHVFQNLIGNALKFHAPGRPPRVTVSATREPGRTAFHVQDNGIGIEPQYFERIFGVFQRLHGVGEYSGSGIGLAVTRSAVEQHGGELWLDSVPGAGTTFHFSLPDTVPDSAAAPQSQPSPGQPAQSQPVQSQPSQEPSA